MSVIKKGSSGAAVRGIQLRLNTRLNPSPKLNVDGHFGPSTEAAVVRFQRDKGLATDGVVGGKTSVALAAAPSSPSPPNLAKFLAELGTADDFVRHVATVAATRTSTAAVLQALGEFFGTAGSKRYLLVKGDKVGVIDFRHFFAAAGESYNSTRSLGQGGVRLGGSPGQTILLGVGLELAQCFQEAVAREMNSCFSPEDPGSNRLGAGFGEFLKVREAEARGQSVSLLLREYLTRLQPLPPDRIDSVKMSGRWDVALEALAAIVAGIGDILVPRAY